MGKSDILIVALIILFVTTIGYFIAKNDIANNKKWQDFKTQHNCKVISHKDATSIPITGFSTNGGMVFSSLDTPAQTCWICDDGVTYCK